MGTIASFQRSYSADLAFDTRLITDIVVYAACTHLQCTCVYTIDMQVLARKVLLAMNWRAARTLDPRALSVTLARTQGAPMSPKVPVRRSYWPASASSPSQVTMPCVILCEHTRHALLLAE